MKALHVTVFLMLSIPWLHQSECASDHVKEKTHHARHHHGKRPCSLVLKSPRITDWGGWLDYFSVCPNNTFVIGMQLKTDAFRGNTNNGFKGDNTAVNGVKFLCGISSLPQNDSNVETVGGQRKPKVVKRITNQEQKWGKWGRVFVCKRGHAIGFQLRVQKSLPDGEGVGFKVDDVATCNMRLFCSDGQILEGDGRNEWGNWTEESRMCPEDHAICSLKTQIERDQFIFDDTALNNVDVGCCKLKQTLLSQGSSNNETENQGSQEGKRKRRNHKDEKSGANSIVEFFKSVGSKTEKFFRDLMPRG